MKIVVGLGNPGKEYENTRHNIGFMIIDKLLSDYSIFDKKTKFQAVVSEKNINGEKIIFLKPQTYMNLSGNSLIEAINFYKLDAEKDVIVIYDDMDLPFGQLRVKDKGSSGGHNGIKSIISHLGNNFIRVKCGIGSKKDGAIEHVLGKFSQTEQENLSKMINEASSCIKDILNSTDLNQIMQNYNKKKIITC